MTELTPVAIRLTKEIGLQTVFNLLRAKYDKFIVSRELAPHEHYHILLYGSDYGADNRNLRNWFHKVFNAEGNKDISIKLSNKPNTMASYVVKDGDFLQQGFTEEEMKKFIKLSYKKIKKGNWNEAVEEIRQEYLNSNILTDQTDQDFIKAVEKYTKLYAIYNRPTNTNHIDNMTLTWYNQKHEQNSNVIAKAIYARQEKFRNLVYL